MIKSISAINFKGEQIKMVLSEPWDSGFYVKSVDGLGPPKANINTTEISGADGSEFNSARAESRNIVLQLGFLPGESTYISTTTVPGFEFPFENPGTNKKNLYFGAITEEKKIRYGLIEETRLKSYQFFPIKKPLTLYVETDKRQLYIDGYVETNEPDIFSDQEGCQISIVCPQPYFYSDSKVSIISGVEQEFYFPFSNESLIENKIIFGNIENNRYKDVEYLGDVDAGLTINLHMVADIKATEIILVNNTTDETMSIDTTIIKSIRENATNQSSDYTLFAGDDILISTVRGDRSITYNHDATLYNVLNSVARGTQWLKLYNGINRVGYAAYYLNDNKKDYEDTKNIEVKIGYKDLYEGI